MVAYYGMSDKLKDISYYDSTGRHEYGFTKPYSDSTAELIDEETKRIIAKQMVRAKDILTNHAEGHHQIAEMLIEKEVITSEDVEAILGPRPWKSRGDELLEANAEMQKKEEKPKRKRAPRKKEAESLRRREEVESQEPKEDI
jgi:cell division protease FtsH